MRGLRVMRPRSRYEELSNDPSLSPGCIQVEEEKARRHAVASELADVSQFYIVTIN